MSLRNLLKPTMAKRILFFLLADLLLSALSLYLAYSLRFNFSVPPEFLDHFFRIYAPLTGLKIGSYAIFRLYQRSWRFFSLLDFKRFLVAHSLAYTLFGVLFLLFRDWFTPFPRSALIIDYLLSLILLGGLRISRRLFLESVGRTDQTKALVIGATPRGAQIIKSSILGEIPYFPVAIIALENLSAVGTYMENVKVYGMEDVPKLLSDHDIDTVLIAEKLPQKRLNEILDRFSELGIKHFKYVNLLSDDKEKLKDIAIEDLLAREPKDLDIETIRRFVKGKKILVTGAGGSIGSEICRQCIDFGADELIAVEQSEYNLYALTETLPPGRCIPKLLSTLDKDGLEEVFKQYNPDIVIHAAAYKHVPLCEANIDKAIENNVLGSIHVIDLSITYGVQKVVNISTDKAVRPTNVMGATKRIVELYAQNIPTEKTEIVSVRFGNVLGSSGSVVPKFKKQIEAGGPVTVTHPEITRYFMLIPEACQLVLQAAAMAKGGELFILDMGEPVKIVDLAKKMIRLYGKEGEVAIEFTGLRPGEKLYEELLIDEAECKTKYESIYVAASTDYPMEKLREDIDALLSAEEKIAALKKIVPEFNPDTNGAV